MKKNLFTNFQLNIFLRSTTAKQKNYKFDKYIGSALGGLYYNGKLYKIVATKYSMTIEVIDLETDKLIYRKNTAQGQAFPYEFQSSNAISHLYSKIDDPKAVQKRIGKNIPVIYHARTNVMLAATFCSKRTLVSIFNRHMIYTYIGYKPILKFVYDYKS